MLKQKKAEFTKGLAQIIRRYSGELEPFMAAAGVKPEHGAIIGTAQGDLHDIGKNLVAMMKSIVDIRVRC